MHHIISTLLIVLIWSLAPMQNFAGNRNTNSSSTLSYDKKEGKLKVFIEGVNLDWDYIRRDMVFVDFVNDPAVADVQIIISKRTNGGGGQAYSLMYHNRVFENMPDFSLSCSTAPGDTHQEARKTIVDTIKLGIMPFVSQTTSGKEIAIKYDGKAAKEQPIITNDPWHNWTFRGDVLGDISLEESRKNYNYSYNLRADKVTENWKYRNSARLSVRTKEYISKGESYRSENSTITASSSVVYSLTPRWSVGMFGNYLNSNYNNLIYSVTTKPAIEYNIFPWDISDRKVFTIAYFIGPEWKKYYEETIYNKLKDDFWEQNFRLELRLVQTWGELFASVNANNYLHDFSMNRVTLNTDLSVRIVRGFSVNFNFGIENIHDQVYLPKGEASLEDILMNNVKLPSSFELYTGLGLRIQFGSIYNNVVNNRL